RRHMLRRCMLSSDRRLRCQSVSERRPEICGRKSSARLLHLDRAAETSLHLPQDNLGRCRRVTLWQFTQEALAMLPATLESAAKGRIVCADVVHPGQVVMRFLVGFSTRPG